MNVKLMRFTADPENIAGMGAAICTNSKDFDKSLEHALASGHESVMEHVYFTFCVEGVSRVLLAQLTRHRIASFSVESQRYVSYKDGFEYVIPRSIEALGSEAVSNYKAQMEQMHVWYCEWCDVLGEKKKEDARYVLPGATHTRLLVSMDARELKHFLSLRCCNRAQWEIREMADKMLGLAQMVAPKLFDDAGPGCVQGHCPEGKRSCGKPRGGKGNG